MAAAATAKDELPAGGIDPLMFVQKTEVAERTPLSPFLDPEQPFVLIRQAHRNQILKSASHVPSVMGIRAGKYEQVKAMYDELEDKRGYAIVPAGVGFAIEQTSSNPYVKAQEIMRNAKEFDEKLFKNAEARQCGKRPPFPTIANIHEYDNALREERTKVDDDFRHHRFVEGFETLTGIRLKDDETALKVYADFEAQMKVDDLTRFSVVEQGRRYAAPQTCLVLATIRDYDRIAKHCARLKEYRQKVYAKYEELERTYFDEQFAMVTDPETGIFTDLSREELEEDVYQLSIAHFTKNPHPRMIRYRAALWAVYENAVRYWRFEQEKAVQYVPEQYKEPQFPPIDQLQMYWCRVSADQAKIAAAKDGHDPRRVDTSMFSIAEASKLKSAELLMFYLRYEYLKRHSISEEECLKLSPRELYDDFKRAWILGHTTISTEDLARINALEPPPPEELLSKATYDPPAHEDAPTDRMFAGWLDKHAAPDVMFWGLEETLEEDSEMMEWLYERDAQIRYFRWNCIGIEMPSKDFLFERYKCDKEFTPPRILSDTTIGTEEPVYIFIRAFATKEDATKWIAENTQPDMDALRQLDLASPNMNVWLYHGDAYDPCLARRYASEEHTEIHKASRNASKEAKSVMHQAELMKSTVKTTTIGHDVVQTETIPEGLTIRDIKIAELEREYMRKENARYAEEMNARKERNIERLIKTYGVSKRKANQYLDRVPPELLDDVTKPAEEPDDFYMKKIPGYERIHMEGRMEKVDMPDFAAIVDEMIARGELRPERKTNVRMLHQGLNSVRRRRIPLTGVPSSLDETSIDVSAETKERMEAVKTADMDVLEASAAAKQPPSALAATEAMRASLAGEASAGPPKFYGGASTIGSTARSVVLSSYSTFMDTLEPKCLIAAKELDVDA